jgi:hypothetical protein
MITRKIWLLLLVCVVLVAVIWRQAACHAPILYRIGHVDTQFGLSESYEAARTAHQERAQAYNAHVQQWHAQGGAPVQVQKTLAAERAQIEASITIHPI